MMIPLQSTIYILGSGGFANEIATYLREMASPSTSTGPLSSQLNSNLNIFYVDNNAAGDKILSVKEYRNKFSTFSTTPRFSIMGSGQSSIKQQMLKEIVEPFISIRHIKSNVSSTAKIGKGSVIAPGAVVAARVILGEHVLANYNCKLGHDSVIGDLSVISPGAFVGGFCKLGQSVYVGANASIKENIVVGDNSVIAMGAAVLNNVPQNSIAVGTPAMIFPLEKWDIIKTQLSSNLKCEQNRIEKIISSI